VAELVRRSGGPVYILNDNEESGEGGKGAANIAYNLISQALDGARVFIGSPPRPRRYRRRWTLTTSSGPAVTSTR